MNQFYKKIESIIDPKDMDYNKISRLHGYKCQLFRDPDFKFYLMEVYVPFLIQKGIDRINQYEASMRALKPKIEYKTKLSFGSNFLKRRLTKNLKNKVIDQIVL